MLAAFAVGTNAQIPQCNNREVRAVWFTTIGGLDWPKGYARNAAGVERQKKQLCEHLDRLQAMGINTLLLQTRIRGTVIYPSAIEPWDGCCRELRACRRDMMRCNSPQKSATNAE